MKYELALGINSINDYVKFYIDLQMQNSVSLLSFINNEKIILKHKMENKKKGKDSISNGIKMLEELVQEIKDKGEDAVLEKYSKY